MMILSRYFEPKVNLHLAPRLYEGIPAGSVVGVSGDGNREWILEFLQSNPTLETAWLEDVMEVLPTALKVKNISLHRIAFLESNENWNKALSHVLRSNHFDLIILPTAWVQNLESRTAWQRFLAWVKDAGITVFLVSDYPERSLKTPIQVHTWFKEKRMYATRLEKLKLSSKS